MYFERKKWNESITFASTIEDIFKRVHASSILIWSFVMYLKHLWSPLLGVTKTGTVINCSEMFEAIVTFRPKSSMFALLSVLDASAWQRNVRWHRADEMCSKCLKLEFKVAVCNCSIKVLWCATIISTYQKRESKASLMRVCCSAPSVQTVPGSLCNYGNGVFVFIGWAHKWLPCSVLQLQNITLEIKLAVFQIKAAISVLCMICWSPV